ncbi:MAG: hypothetical protein ABW123_08895 [Cystobacter sp.]
MAHLPTVRPLLPLVLFLCLDAGCTRANLQNEGRYQFTAREVIRDDCGLLSTEDSLWDGELTIRGDVVRFDSDWRGLQLIGFVLPGGSDDDDAFIVDGSESKAAISLQGTECIVDQLWMHLDGTTQCATQFNGVLSVRLEPRVEQPNCACQLWVSYEAVQNSGCQ